MKYRILAMLLVLLLALTACGAPAETAETAETVETVETTETTEAAASEAEEPSKLETALTFTDKAASELAAAIGEPADRRYEASCSGPGDDGVWQYDGFIVFTYREPDGSAETVVDAEAE